MRYVCLLNRLNEDFNRPKSIGFTIRNSGDVFLHLSDKLFLHTDQISEASVNKFCDWLDCMSRVKSTLGEVRKSITHHIYNLSCYSSEIKICLSISSYFSSASEMLNFKFISNNVDLELSFDLEPNESLWGLSFSSSKVTQKPGSNAEIHF
jgi:hypothetical protein